MNWVTKRNGGLPRRQQPSHLIEHLGDLLNANSRKMSRFAYFFISFILERRAKHFNFELFCKVIVYIDQSRLIVFRRVRNMTQKKVYKKTHLEHFKHINLHYGKTSKKKIKNIFIMCCKSFTVALKTEKHTFEIWCRILKRFLRRSSSLKKGTFSRNEEAEKSNE